LRDDVSVPYHADESLSGAAAALLHRRIKKRVPDETEPARGSLVFGLPAARKHRPKGAQAQQPAASIDAGEAQAASQPASPLTISDSADSGARKPNAGPKGLRMQDDLLFTLAKCCAPIPGDEVKGYITRGRGVTVHRADCSNLKHYEQREPDRLVEARWQGEQAHASGALIAIEATDRVGLLLEVTSIITGLKINISGVNTYPLKNNRARLNIAVTIANLDELTDVMRAIAGVSGVTDVHRV
jgi:(p)ppGpp synthase/HD superfamily hydrolase